MANVTQQIPNFLGGYSQKPDFEKPLNCVSSLINGYPDVTAGLCKRPGTLFINKLALASNTLPEDYKWFNIEHNNESYIGAVGKNTLKVWKTETGQECTVVTTNAATNYLSVVTSYNADAYSTFKTATFEKATIICNTSVTVAASSTTNTGITLSNHYEENSLADLQSGSTGTPGTDVFTIKNTNTDKDDILILSLTPLMIKNHAWRARGPSVNYFCSPTHQIVSGKYFLQGRRVMTVSRYGCVIIYQSDPDSNHILAGFIRISGYKPIYI